KVPGSHLTKDAALDARLLNRRPGPRRARHGAARVDRPRGRDAAAERRVLLRLDLVAGLERAAMGHDHAPDLFRTQAAVRRAAAAARRNAVLAGPVPAPVPAPSPTPPEAAGAAPARSARAGAEAAAVAGTPAGVERARAEHDARAGPSASGARAVQPRSGAAPEDDVGRVETPERVGDGGDLAQRLLDVRSGVGQRFTEAAIVRGGLDIAGQLGVVLLAVHAGF